MNDIDDYWNKRVAHLEGENATLREVIEAVQTAENRLNTGDDPDEEDAIQGVYTDAIERLLRYNLNSEAGTPEAT